MNTRGNEVVAACGEKCRKNNRMTKDHHDNFENATYVHRYLKNSLLKQNDNCNSKDKDYYWQNFFFCGIIHFLLINYVRKIWNFEFEIEILCRIF